MNKLTQSSVESVAGAEFKAPPKEALSSAEGGVFFEQFESFARQGVQSFLQRLLEEEVEELLGRSKSERRTADCPVGYRNGHGHERSLSTSIGTIRVRRPRVRDLQERFVSLVLPLFKKRTQEVGEMLPALYLHGLALGDFELALRGLLGEGAPLSASSIDRMRSEWLREYDQWRRRPLDRTHVAYLWVDGIYVKAGLEKDKACLLVAIAGLLDGTKVVLAVEAGLRESTATWGSLLRSLRDRGLRCPRLVIGDGALGIWAALDGVYPDASQQRCWNHRIRNILDCVGKKKQAQAKQMLSDVMYAPTEREAVAAKDAFVLWANEQQYPKAAERIETDWDRMVAYYSFPDEHWKHLRTTNVVESPFCSIRLRTAAAKRYKKVVGATAMIWKLLMVAEQTFRKLNAPDLMLKVCCGIQFKDGVEVHEDVSQTREYKQAA